MQKYAKVIDHKKGICEVGIGDPDAVFNIEEIMIESPSEENPDGVFEEKTIYVRDYYESMGMELMDVVQGGDGNWYLSGFAPVKSATISELIEFVSAEADKVAYGGITIIANGQKYLFKTTTDNITRCNSVLAMYEVLPEDTTIPWEVWQGDIPVMLPVNKAQFKQCFAFGSQMIISVETVKGSINTEVRRLTKEQLADADYVMAFKKNTVIQLAGVNTVFSLDAVTE